MNFALALVASALFVTPLRAEIFKEDFSEGLDPKRWMISAWVAPHNSEHNQTVFRTEHVKIVGGLLQLKLTQELGADGNFRSYGGEVQTVAKFGYGSYEFILKASSSDIDPFSSSGKPVSGSITGAFLFLLNSETEIDIEYEGVAGRSHLMQASTWVDEKSLPEMTKAPISIFAALPHQRFNRYKWIWTPGKVSFFRDGVLIGTHTKVVPEKPAPMIFNHWGTHSNDWGGLATPNVPRYVYIKSFSFTPLE